MHAEEEKDIDRAEFPVAEFARHCALSKGSLTHTSARQVFASTGSKMHAPPKRASRIQTSTCVLGYTVVSGLVIST